MLVFCDGKEKLSHPAAANTIDSTQLNPSTTTIVLVLVMPPASGGSDG
jgi:hypothetical protein